MLRVGLTGGLATGKSFVGRTLESLGCRLLRADDLGHEVLAPGGEAYEPVVAHFGSGILKEDGSIDRRVLGSVVFEQPDQLAVLNSLVHPAVIKREEEWIAQWAGEPGAVVVVEAAIMYETGTWQRYDKMIVTYCSRKQQIERAMDRDELTREEVELRLSRQMPLEEKVRRADFAIDTSGPKPETVRQTIHVYQQLRSLAR